MKILFLLTARFPSNKAYSVTTSGTISAMQSLGHETYVVSSSDVETASEEYFMKWLFKFRSSLFSKKYLGRFAFNILRIKVFLRAQRLYGGEIDLVWSRELSLTCLTVLFMRKIIVVSEIHQRQENVNRILLYFLSKSRRVIICPIKVSLTKQSRGSRYSQVLAPMAVDLDFIRIGQERVVTDRGEFNKILYIGNVSNTHQEECVQYFVRNMIPLFDCSQIESVTLIGIPSFWLEKHFPAEVTCNPKIKNMGYVNHEVIPKLILPGMIGVISYFENSYFENTFPIKAVEYAALKVPVIVSDTKANREVFPEGCGVFFQIKSGGLELSQRILEIIKDPIELVNQSTRAFTWAQELTYEKRASRILHEVSRRRFDLPPMTSDD